MAGTMRIAAKLLICTTVLATGGAGVYHYQSGGDWSRLWNESGDGATAKLVADDSHDLSAADLDAVTSSWATVRDPRPAESNATSPAARSADATLSSAEPAPTPPTKRDRYAIPAVAETPAAEASSELSSDDSTDAEPGRPPNTFQAWQKINRPSRTPTLHPRRQMLNRLRRSPVVRIQTTTTVRRISPPR